MSFAVPEACFRNQTIYHHSAGDSEANLFGCGFLNKVSPEYREEDIVFRHYGVVLVLHGNGVHTDASGRSSPVSAGCLIQRIPGLSQTLRVDPSGNWLEFFICISKGLYDALVTMGLLDTAQTVLNPGLSQAVFDKLTELFRKMNQAKATELNLLVPDALACILMLHDLHRVRNNRSEESDLINHACLMLADPAMRHMSMQEVAAALNVGYEKFRKLFRSRMGMSPAGYAMLRRIDAARLMLTAGNVSIKEIALELGFADAYAFSKQFKAVTGHAPSAYRKVH